MNLVKKERLLFICNWDKQKEKTWSGTPYHLMMELKKYFNISDVDVSLNFVQKVICKLLSFKIEKGKIAKESSVFNKHISKIMTKKAKKAIKNYDGEYVLETGDLFSTREKKYSYTRI